MSSTLVLGISSAMIFAPKAAQAQFTTQYPQAQMQGLGDWKTEAIFTVGETVEGYTPVGILDGIGAFKINDNLVRVLVNSEIAAGVGATYNLNTLDSNPSNNLTVNGGARIHYFDINANTRKVVDAGLAFDRVFDRAGNLITSSTQFPTGASLNRFCSGQHFDAGTYGFVDNVYFAGEETNGGTQFVLDVDAISNSPLGGALYAAPALGRGAWENVTAIDPGNTTQVALLLGDDRGGAPLYLYLGDKNAKGDNSFLDRNGLAQGKLYMWKADNGDTSPQAWNGTGSNRTGTWVEVTNYDPLQAGQTGFDALGYATQANLDGQQATLGAFRFSRPEDVSTNPLNGSQVVMASTGRDSLFPADSWGTVYTIDVDLANLTADLNILYDGDDAGNGQFSGPDFGLRSADNLDWADDGFIYVQEDKSVSAFCQTSGQEASIWQINPNTGILNRVAQMDRSVVVPTGVTDNMPNPPITNCGNWESSGILDVTNLFPTKTGEKLFILDTQAHSLRNGVISSQNLVEGGQLILMSNTVPEPSSVLGLVLFGLGAIAVKGNKNL